MSAPEKAEVVTKVSSSPLPKRKVLRELGIPKSTYYIKSSPLIVNQRNVDGT